MPEIHDTQYFQARLDLYLHLDLCPDFCPLTLRYFPSTENASMTLPAIKPSDP